MPDGKGASQAADSSAAGWRDYLLLLLLSLLFGASFTLTSLAVREVPPFTVVSTRLLVAMLIFVVLMVIAGQKLPRGAGVWAGIAGAAFFGNALPFCLINWAQLRVDAGLTAIYMAIMPLGTVLIAHFVTVDEKLNLLKLVGVVAGIIGVAVLMGLGQLGLMGGNLLSELAIIGAALCYSVNAVITRFLVNLDKRSLLSGLMILSVVMVLPLSLYFDQPWSLQPSAMAILSMLALGVGPTAIATLLLIVIIARQGASFLSQINFIVPLVGAAMGVYLLDESLPPNALVALVCILLGIAMVLSLIHI